MKYLLVFIICILPITGGNSLLAQTPSTTTNQEQLTIRGTVRSKYSFEPIENVGVFINGGKYTSTNKQGDFRVKAKTGDELMIKHNSFETVYHTIQSDDRIIIEVEGNLEQSVEQTASVKSPSRFNSLIDSINTYSTKDIEKSLGFVSQALSQSSSISENAEAYETLADVYSHWKQYDLAISNYRISLQNQNSNRVRLKLAKNYELIDNLNQSLQTYNLINPEKLSNYNKIIFYEGLGDVYFKMKEFDKAVNNYYKAKDIAELNAAESKLADLASKAGTVFSMDGNTAKAEQNFDAALDFASEVNEEREAEEKVKIADFRNKNKNYDDEIKMRKEVIDNIESIERDSIMPNESALTLQKQNYKIGNAYYLNNDNSNAINYFEKSIEEADKKEDLEVKKDALKKISDIYVKTGNYEKAKETFEIYIATVDELYIKREQEISQSARLTRKIAENQSRITSLEMDRQLSESSYQLSEERSKRQEVIIYSLVAGLLLVLGLSYLLYKYLRQQRLTNDILALKSLRSQMNPHFIFNALNSVNSFIANNDERTANRYLTDFSYLMREVLENSEENFIPLEKEIHLLELYTKLEHFRFQDKFEYSINIDKNIDPKDFEIPPMLLQPYIENAVWHGLRYKKEMGQLNIDLNKLNEETIEITIADNGIGRTESKKLKTQNQDKHKSKGLSNIQKRVAILNRMHKDKINIEIEDQDNVDGTGTIVKVILKK